MPHLPRLHLSPNSPHPILLAQWICKRENKTHTHVITNPMRFLASGDCLVKSFLPLCVHAGHSSHPLAAAGSGG